jgi:hypothetical protein
MKLIATQTTSIDITGLDSIIHIKEGEIYDIPDSSAKLWITKGYFKQPAQKKPGPVKKEQPQP